jgi:Bacterial regulatory proteins, luxR family
MAFSRTNARRALAAWEEGIAFVHEHRIGFFEGFIARDAARLHTSDGEPDVALGLFTAAIQAFHRAGNVPQLITTLASVPALFERLDRFEPAAMLLGAMSRESSSFHHVPELAELGDRLTARLGATKAAELVAAGAVLDLDAAAGYARGQVDAARRDPRPGPRCARPGGLREIATELFISARTAEHHVQNIYTKIGVSNRAAATRWAVAHRRLAHAAVRSDHRPPPLTRLNSALRKHGLFGAVGLGHSKTPYFPVFGQAGTSPGRNLPPAPGDGRVSSNFSFRDRPLRPWKGSPTCYARPGTTRLSSAAGWAPKAARQRWPACSRSPAARRSWPWPPARTPAKASTARPGHPVPRRAGRQQGQPDPVRRPDPAHA